MLFNSFEFLIFLPIVFLLYWHICKTKYQQNLLIVIASYMFYGWWDWRFLVLIAFTSLCSYVSGIAINYFNGERVKQKCISAANIVVNLSILGIFKYFNFFTESFANLFRAFGFYIDTVTLNLILPVGISFYTFQALSYSIDVYQNKIKPTKDIIQFFAYISFFPQLVAGPIERATNLLPQFNKKREFDYTQSVDGARQILWGFLKKVVVADNCASIVNDYWGNYESIPSLSLILLGILFTIQIYCDFSGYSDIAIGCGHLFGIKLMRNFNNPYFSRSVPEFWRRWHISLMTWFRDYIYIPLGGSRCGRWKTVRNIFVVWGVSGLWHGANWTFVSWGIYHAILLIIYNAIGVSTKHKKEEAAGHLLPSIKELNQMSFTFILVVIGWIIFRAESMEQLCDFSTHIYTNNFYGSTCVIMVKPLILGIILLLIEWLQRDKQHALQLEKIQFLKNRSIRWALYYIIIMVIVMLSGTNQSFIYFQF